MSVKKRRQAKALQSLAAKLPLTNLAGGALIAFGMYEGFSLSEGGLIALAYALIGGVLGLVIYGAVQRPVQSAENRWRVKVREFASKIESKADEEQGGNNKLLDAYDIHYIGGHPGWVLKENRPYGTLEIYQKSLVFKTKNNRIRFGLGRVKRATIEPEHLMQVRKLAGVLLPSSKGLKQPMLDKLLRAAARKRKYLVLDYTDDLGARTTVAFMAPLGNPLPLKPVQAAINDALRHAPKEKKKDTRVQASEETIAAAEAATLNAMRPAVNYQVVIDQAGADDAARAQIAEQIAEQFKAETARVAAALESLPMVARRNLNREQAERWVGILGRIGAVARIEEMDPAARA